MRDFKLSEKFLDQFRGKQPKWGPLGAVTYYRTYSRMKDDGTQEEFWETLQRVVEGCFSIQKKHCKSLHVDWDNEKAQRSAQEMFTRMWEFKFIAPGRSLWLAGTVDLDRHAAGLLNCAFRSTDDVAIDLAEPFCWTMEMLMLGVGCIAKDTFVMTSEGAKKIQELSGTPFYAVINGKEFLAPQGSWSTGIKDVVNLDTTHGFSLKLTPDHRVQKVSRKKSRTGIVETVEWVATESLVPGDKIKLNNFDNYLDWQGEGTFSEGYVTGVVLADGWFNHHTVVAAVHSNKPGALSLMDSIEEHIQKVDRRDIAAQWRDHRDSIEITVGNWITNYLSRSPKEPLDTVETSSSDFHKGFLRGMFDMDGYVSSSVKKNTHTIGLCQSNLNTLKVVQRMLLRLGIVSSINKKREGSETVICGRKCYQNAAWTLVIAGDDLVKFSKIIGFYNSDKLSKLNKLMSLERKKKPRNLYFTTRVKSVSSAGKVETFDISVPGADSFDAHGFIVHNCGHSTDGAGKVVIQEPRAGSHTFVVEDSREGWVAALRSVILPFSGKGCLPVNFDYSKVRPFGALIKGFGGVASGPEPLDLLLKDVESTLRRNVGSTLSVTSIVDIMNLIARCVIAGSVRRSAEISFGDYNNEEFLNLKNPVTNQERLMSHGWASNNSIYADIGMDYSRVAESMASNGEPGVLWLANARKYGRFKDAPDNADYRVTGTNPCFSGDTLIAVADGRNYVSIKQLADEGNDVPVYSLNPTTFKTEIKWGRHPRITGYEQKLLRVHFNEGGYLDVTPNHKMILRDGSELEARELQPGMSLPRFTKRLEPVTSKSKNSNSKDYYQIAMYPRNPRYERIFEHKLISQFFEPEKWESMYSENKGNGWIKGGLVVHHKDYNSLNNSPDNLELMTFQDHTAFHARNDCQGEKNGMFGREHAESSKALIGEKTKERWKSPEFRAEWSVAHAASITEETRKAISDSRINHCSNQSESYAILNGLKYFKNEVGQIVYVKSCEICGKEFHVSYSKRERAFCSQDCGNQYINNRSLNAEMNKKRVENQNKVFVEKQKVTLDNQIKVFKSLQQSLGREPQKKEWELACKEASVPFRIQAKSQAAGNNPYVVNTYKELKQRAAEFNHSVKYVEELEGTHTVYNITVDDNHTLATIIPHEGSKVTSGVYVANCGEQPLESGECCCLVETFPANHDSIEDYKKTLKYAYLYGKTVTLVPTHSNKTNAIMQRNRRIGTSMSGIAQAISKFGRHKFFELCDASYLYLKDLDKLYSEWLCVPRSIRMSTVKPSGTTALLNGATPGIHFPHSEFYIRRIRFQENSPLVDIHRKHGYNVEQDAYSPNTVCVEFPIHEKHFSRSKSDVTMWEQLELAASMQKYWSDNAVSVTVTVKPEEVKDIKHALEAYETRLKTVSFLPLAEHGYVQAPYETITKERYEEMVSKITPIEQYVNIKNEVTERFCTNDVCEIK